MNTTYQGHQGDVYFQSIEGLDLDLSGLPLVKPDEDGQTTIVEGEATHHHHRAQADVYLAANMPTYKAYVCDVKEDAQLEHYHVKEKRATGEHNVIPLHKGMYIVRTQQQADLNGRLFPVAD